MPALSAGGRITPTDTADPSSGRIHAQLQPLFDAMVSSPRPQTAIYWLARPPGDGPALLREMVAGRAAIAHETFQALPMNPTRNYLRDLLAAVGVLPPYEPRIERIGPWVDNLIRDLSEVHQHTIMQFARWVILRRLRAHSDQGELTKGMVQTARHNVKQTVALLAWLDARDERNTDLTQLELDAYLDDRARHTATTLSPFGHWLNRTGINNNIRIGFIPPSKGQVVMSDADRWRHVHTLLHDASIRRYVRIAGLFMLLFTQTVTGISRMRNNQVDASDPPRVFVTFQRTPVEMPEPLGQLLREQLGERGRASYATETNEWLFPGMIPGRHLATENIRSQLVTFGIRPHTARHAAMLSLAAEVPHMILAQTLGISQTAATH